MTKREREHVYRRAAERIFYSKNFRIAWLVLFEFAGEDDEMIDFPEMDICFTEDLFQNTKEHRILALLFCAEMCKPNSKTV
jgi:hypothetical protein